MEVILNYTAEEVETLRDALQFRMKSCESLLAKLVSQNGLTVKNQSNPKPALSRARGPLPAAEEQERTKKICQLLAQNGGKDVSVKTIADSIGQNPDTISIWMKRRLPRPECPWKIGKGASFFTLKNN